MKIIENFPYKMGASTMVSPAADHLFQLSNATEAKLLPEESSIQFHHTVAQLLFVSTKAWRDIQSEAYF